jgi:hypothetical protein
VISAQSIYHYFWRSEGSLFTLHRHVHASNDDNDEEEEEEKWQQTTTQW